MYFRGKKFYTMHLHYAWLHYDVTMGSLATPPLLNFILQGTQCRIEVREDQLVPKAVSEWKGTGSRKPQGREDAVSALVYLEMTVGSESAVSCCPGQRQPELELTLVDAVYSPQSHQPTEV